MITVKNKADHVIVLKAQGLPTLRLFPGQNHVNVKSADDMKPYLDGNKAAEYHFKTDLTLVTGDSVCDSEALAAKEKNDALNLKKLGR